MQIINTSDGLTIKPNNDISLGKASPLCRTIFFQGYHQNSTFSGQMMEPNNAPKKRNILTPEPDIASSYLTFFDEPARHKFGCINSNGKADPLCGKNHSCIDPDDISLRRDQGSSRISRIQGRICLDDVVY